MFESYLFGVDFGEVSIRKGNPKVASSAWITWYITVIMHTKFKFFETNQIDYLNWFHSFNDETIMNTLTSFVMNLSFLSIQCQIKARIGAQANANCSAWDECCWSGARCLCWMRPLLPSTLPLMHSSRKSSARSSVLVLSLLSPIVSPRSSTVTLSLHLVTVYIPSYIHLFCSLPRYFISIHHSFLMIHKFCDITYCSNAHGWLHCPLITRPLRHSFFHYKLKRQSYLHISWDIMINIWDVSSM